MAVLVHSLLFVATRDFVQNFDDYIEICFKISSLRCKPIKPGKVLLNNCSLVLANSTNVWPDCFLPIRNFSKTRQKHCINKAQYSFGHFKFFAASKWIFLKICIYNQFQMSWDRCHKTFEFQQTSIYPPPRPLFNVVFNVVSHFLSGLMCFGLSNIDWGVGRGRGAVLCVTNCNDPFTI